MSHLPSPTYRIAERVIEFLYQYQNGYAISSTAKMLDRVLHNAIAPNVDRTFEQILIDDVYSQYTRSRLYCPQFDTPAMKKLSGKFLVVLTRAQTVVLT